MLELLASAGFRLSPLAATRPESVPVIKTVSVESKDMKSASLGDCSSGWVTNKRPKVKPMTVSAKVTAIVHPINTIMRACRTSISALSLAISGLASVSYSAFNYQRAIANFDRCVCACCFASGQDKRKHDAKSYQPLAVQSLCRSMCNQYLHKFCLAN